MPTIDELIIKVSIDAAGAEEGQKKLHDEMERTRKHTDEVAKQVAESGKKAAEFFKHLRDEAIALFAVVTGGMGLEKFTETTIEGAAAQAQFAEDIGMSTKALQSWTEAGIIMGGTADDMKQSMHGISVAVRDFTNYGKTSETTRVLSELGIPVAHMRDMDKLLPELARKFQALREAGVSTPDIEAYMRRMNLSPTMMHTLLDPGIFQKIDEGMKRALSDENTEKATKLAESWQQLLLTLKDFAQNTFLNTFGTDMQGAITATQKWLDANKGWLEGQIGKKVNEVVADLKAAYNSAEFQKFLDFLGWLKDAFIAVCNAVGGPTNMLELFLGLFIANKIAGPIAGIVSLTAAVANLARALAFSPLGLATIAAITTWLALRIPSAGGGADEDKRLRDESIARDPSLLRPRPAQPGYREWLYRTSGAGGLKEQIESTDLSWTQKDFLDFIAGPESGGAYDVKNGGSTFSDFSKFPEGVGPGGTSSAAGRYQITSETWKDILKANPEMAQFGFGRRNQDLGAWWLAASTYQRKTGRDLLSDLKEGGHWDLITTSLAGRWPWMPGTQDMKLGFVTGPGGQGRPSVPDPEQHPVPRGEPSTMPNPGRPPGAPVIPMPRHPIAYHTGGTSNVHIQNLNVYSAANDARGLVRDLRAELQKNIALVGSINTGMA